MTALVVGGGSYLKGIKDFIKRVNELNDFDLAWRWNDKSAIAQGRLSEPEIVVYEEADGRILCISFPDQTIESMKRWMPDWGLEDPDD